MSGLLSLSDRRSYHLYHKETDMRKGFNQLCLTPSTSNKKTRHNRSEFLRGP